MVGDKHHKLPEEPWVLPPALPQNTDGGLGQPLTTLPCGVPAPGTDTWSGSPRAQPHPLQRSDVASVKRSAPPTH